jgi:hypothetical protein
MAELGLTGELSGEPDAELELDVLTRFRLKLELEANFEFVLNSGQSSGLDCGDEYVELTDEDGVEAVGRSGELLGLDTCFPYLPILAEIR